MRKLITTMAETAATYLEKMLLNPKISVLRRKLLILFLATLSSIESKQILLRTLIIDTQKLKKSLVQNILDAHIIWTKSEKTFILNQCLNKDIDRMSWLIHLREVFMNAPTHESEESFEFLLRALQEDIDDTRDLILYQLLLLQNNEMFTHAVEILMTDQYELYLPAMGMIQDLTSTRLYQKLKPILILPLSQKRKATLSGLTITEAVENLSQMIT